jgi:hypothetical protein
MESKTLSSDVQVIKTPDNVVQEDDLSQLTFEQVEEKYASLCQESYRMGYRMNDPEFTQQRTDFLTSLDGVNPDAVNYLAEQNSEGVARRTTIERMEWLKSQAVAG